MGEINVELECIMLKMDLILLMSFCRGNKQARNICLKPRFIKAKSKKTCTDLLEWLSLDCFHRAGDHRIYVDM